MASPSHTVPRTVLSWKYLLHKKTGVGCRVCLSCASQGGAPPLPSATTGSSALRTERNHLHQGLPLPKPPFFLLPGCLDLPQTHPQSHLLLPGLVLASPSLPHIWCLTDAHQGQSLCVTSPSREVGARYLRYVLWLSFCVLCHIILAHCHFCLLAFRLGLYLPCTQWWSWCPRVS